MTPPRRGHRVPARKKPASPDVPRRRTRQRDAIRRALEQAGAPVSPREILASAARASRGLGLATVYRTLRAMTEAGEIVPVGVGGEPPRYELAGKAHHHHFHCRACARVYEVDGCPRDLAALTPPGFRLLGHDLMLFGVCAACAKRAPRGADDQ